jgi:hypothetical protein
MVGTVQPADGKRREALDAAAPDGGVGGQLDVDGADGHPAAVPHDHRDLTARRRDEVGQLAVEVEVDDPARGGALRREV